MSRRGFYDDTYNDTGCRHFQKRAVGQLVLGPIKAKGYDNRVLQLTVNEVDFKSSAEANRFADHMRRKYDNKAGLCKARRMKLLSIGSD
jgi:hypothetical protein